MNTRERVMWLRKELGARHINHRITNVIGGHSEKRRLIIVYVDRFVHDREEFTNNGFILIEKGSI